MFLDRNRTQTLAHRPKRRQDKKRSRRKWIIRTAELVRRFYFDVDVVGDVDDDDVAEKGIVVLVCFVYNNVESF